MTRDYAEHVAPDVRVADTHCVEFSDEISKVVLGSGDSRKTFIIHTAVLRKRTLGFLDLAKDQKHNTLELPAIKPEVFNLYLQHLYTQQLPSKPSSSDLDLDDHAHEITLLCMLFALAKTMRDDLATKHAINAIYAKAHEQPLEAHPLLPSSADIAIIYNATHGPCGVRRLMVDLHVWKAASQWVKDHVSSGLPYPAEFLSDLAIALLEQCEDRSKTLKLEKEVSEYYNST